MQLDSKAPSIPLRAYRENETRFRILSQQHPVEAEAFLRLAEASVQRRWRELERIAGVHHDAPSAVGADD